MLTRDQKIVGIGAASGVAPMIVAIAGTYQLWPSSPNLVDISSRLAYAELDRRTPAQRPNRHASAALQGLTWSTLGS